MAFDFMLPVPERPGRSFDEDLDRMRGASPDAVAGEVEAAYASIERRPPMALQPFVDNSRAALERLAEELRQYWEATLAHRWPAVRALLEAEVLHGAHRQVTGGVDAFLGDLHPGLRWDRSALELHGPDERLFESSGRGVVFVATAFAWPEVAAGISREGTPLIAYQARGTALLWEALPPDPEHALELLLGRERAAVLRSLRVPRSTSDLAKLLGGAASSISYHLAVLRTAALVESHREGRRVLYRISPVGESLLRLWETVPGGRPERGKHWREPAWTRTDLSKSLESFPLPRPPF
jgi:DNA-binding transcriptional ArsR family regulator